MNGRSVMSCCPFERIYFALYIFFFSSYSVVDLLRKRFHSPSKGCFFFLHTFSCLFLSCYMILVFFMVLVLCFFIFYFMVIVFYFYFYCFCLFLFYFILCLYLILWFWFVFILFFGLIFYLNELLVFLVTVILLAWDYCQQK